MSDTNDEPGAIRLRYLVLPVWMVIGATALGALAGGGLLDLATRGPSAWLGLIGVITATLSALVVVDSTRFWSRREPAAGWRSFVAVEVLVGVALLVVAEIKRWPFPAFAGLMAFTVVVGPVLVWITSSVRERREGWMQVGMILSAVGAFVFSLSGPPTWVRLAAAAAVLIGLAAFIAGLTPHTETGEPPRAPLLRLLPGDAGRRGVVAAAIGLSVVVLGRFVGSAPATALGLWLVLISMVVLSVRPRRLGLSHTMERTLLGAGVGLVVVGGFQLFATDTVGRSAAFLAFLVAAIMLAGSAIVWRGATLCIAVLVGFAFVWGLFTHEASDAAGVSSGEPDSRTGAVVAFGDSFISGEGAADFFPATNQKGSRQNECRRAPTAYPSLISSVGGSVVANLEADHPSYDDEIGRAVEALGRPGDELDAVAGLGDGLDFFACSGAKLDQVLVPTLGGPRSDNSNRDLSCTPAALDVGQYPCGEAGVHGSRLQIDHLPGSMSEQPVDSEGVAIRDLDAMSDTQLVLVSIGGNDVRFGDIVAGCLLPGSCAERREVWLDNIAALGPELTSGYRRLAEAFGSDDRRGPSIVVMPYPLVLTEDTCAESPLDASEHEFIYEFTTVLNQQIASSARQAGVNFFEEGMFAFDGHRLCEREPRAINILGLLPTDGPPLTRMDPGTWIHNSMHPNPVGHRLTAEALVAWLNADDILAGPNPPQGSDASSELLDVRTARPYAVATDTLGRLGAGPVGECGYEQLSAFATRISVFDEPPADDEDEAPFRVPVVGADPLSKLCVTDGAGNWVELDPQSTEAGDMSEMAMADDAPTARVEDEQVIVTGGRPTDECREQHERDREDADGVCAFQWILFSPPVEVSADPDGNTPTGPPDPDDRTWSLRAVSYCSTDPDCDDTFDEWSATQIARAARRMVAPIALVFLGGWLFAFGVQLVSLPEVARRRRRHDSLGTL